MSDAPNETANEGLPRSLAVLAGVIAISSAAASYIGNYQLARYTGDGEALAVTLPICLDAYTLLATLVWTARRKVSPTARSYARNSAFIGIAMSMLGNGAQRMIELHMISLNGWELFAVASVPTLTLALVIHLFHVAFIAHKTPAAVDQLAMQQAAFDEQTAAREAAFADELAAQTAAFVVQLGEQKLDFTERFAAREAEFAEQLAALQASATPPEDEAPAEKPRQRREPKAKSAPEPEPEPVLRKATLAELMTACYVAKSVDLASPAPTQITRGEVLAACKASGLRIGNDRITEVRELVMKGTNPSENELLQTSGEWDTAEIDAVNGEAAVND